MRLKDCTTNNTTNNCTGLYNEKAGAESPENSRLGLSSLAELSPVSFHFFISSVTFTFLAYHPWPSFRRWVFTFLFALEKADRSEQQKLRMFLFFCPRLYISFPDQTVELLQWPQPQHKEPLPQHWLCKYIFERATNTANELPQCCDVWYGQRTLI